ncbi:leucine-rich repeat-containing protein 37A-like [Sus scrofa]|uniref:leucine-rich repeat-containing protein 37A-like n=1 Tax=Sus scrofa TaxID=9823 RepID=UPI000A2B6310|nr:leucine-rich repeat-containing protein 37A-like [Sus scrofa]
MSRLYLWSPLLLLSWPPLWLLVQVAQASGDWALDHVALTSDPPGLTSERSLDSPHVLAPSAEPGGLAYSTASSPAQMFAPPSQEVTETFVPDPDLDSVDFVEDPDPPTEPPEEVESSLQEEAPAQHPQPTEEVVSPPLEQEALFQPPEAPEEMETSSLQEALLAQASEILKEAGGQPSAHHRVNEAQQSGRHSVTVTPLDLALTVTPEVTKKVEPSPVQQDGLLQAPESPEESETPPVLEEAPPQPPERPEEVDFSLQQETQAQPPERPEEVEPSPVQLGSPAHAPGFPTQDVLQRPESGELEAPHHQPHPLHLHLPNGHLSLWIWDLPSLQGLLRKLSQLQPSRRPCLSLLSTLRRRNLLQPSRRPQRSLQSLLGRSNQLSLQSRLLGRRSLCQLNRNSQLNLQSIMK